MTMEIQNKSAATLPVRAADFINAVGVNTHLDQAGNSASTIMADMAYLGLNHIRNASLSGQSSQFVVRDMGYLATAGLNFDFVTRAAIPGTLKAVAAFAALFPGAVSSLEGPNEVNNFPFYYNGLSGTAAAVAYQTDLYAAEKANPALAQIPVLNFTDNPYTTAPSDASNFHPYPANGGQPLAALALDYAKAQAAAPGDPVYFTEAGYATGPKLAGGQGVDALTQAKLALNLIMDAAQLGIAATYLYTLTDDGTDPAKIVNNYGLFTATGGAKPSAVAIHNLTGLLADPGAGSNTFTPRALNYTLTGLPASGSRLLIQKSNGVYDLVVWAEPTIWNAVTHTRIRVAPTTVSVDLGAIFKSVAVFDPLSSASPISSASNAQTLTLAVTDHPLVIQVSNLAAAMSALAPAAAAVLSSSPAAAGLTHPRLLASAGPHALH